MTPIISKGRKTPTKVLSAIQVPASESENFDKRPSGKQMPTVTQIVLIPNCGMNRANKVGARRGVTMTWVTEMMSAAAPPR